MFVYMYICMYICTLYYIECVHIQVDNVPCIIILLLIIVILHKCRYTCLYLSMRMSDNPATCTFSLGENGPHPSPSPNGSHADAQALALSRRPSSLLRGRDTNACA